MIPDVQLSKREMEVLHLVLQGNSNKQIALLLDTQRFDVTWAQ